MRMQGSRCAIVWEVAQDLVWELSSSPKSEKSTQVGVSLPLHAPGMVCAARIAADSTCLAMATSHLLTHQLPSVLVSQHM